MLEFIPYEKETEIHRLPFIENKEGTYTVICPHPTLADRSRSFFSHDAQVLTISRFIKDKLALAYPEEPIELKGKAELLLFLSGVWRKRLGPQKLETFKQAFKLFTELRSFTLELTLIEEILPEFGEEVSQAVRLFWLVSEQLNLVDEHKSYSLLAEAFRTIENPVNDKAILEGHGERFIFWGFRHLSALQVDFIKALSLRHEIYIPLPQVVLSQIQTADWPSWLGAELLKNPKEEILKEEVYKQVSFAKGRLSETLSAYTLEKNLLKNSVDVLLCTQSPELDQYAEIPLKNLHYRSSLELWKGDFEKIFFSLSERQGSYGEKIEELLKESLKAQHFSRLKILLLFKTVLKEWQELSEDHAEPSFFDEMIIREITLLRLPRNFIFPLMKEAQGSIFSLRESEGLEGNRPLLICASSKYEDLKSGSEAYNTRVMEFLRAIGPVQRKDFAFTFVKNHLRELLRRPESVLFFEEGLMEHMLSWSDILNGFKAQAIFDGKSLERIKKADPLSLQGREAKLDRISATILQSYLDCPRKFYYSYIEKMKERTEFETELRSDELGTLEHEVIEHYLSEEKSFDEEKHTGLVRERLEGYLKRHQKKLPLVEKEKAYWEIRNYSQNGIRSLLKLKENWAGLEFRFEEKFSGELKGLPIKGSADCVMTLPEGWALFDFKRSDSSIPSQKEIENLESVQIPFYLTHLPKAESPCLFWGHINLSEIEKSQVFASEELVLRRLLLADFLEGKKVGQYAPDLKVYTFKEDELMNAIQTDRSFVPKPLNKDVCSFCDLANVCPRGEV